MREYIKSIIDKKIKNLHPDTEREMVDLVLDLGLNTQAKITKFIRNRLNIPKVGKKTRIYWESRGWSKHEVNDRRERVRMPSSPMRIENWLNKVNPKTDKYYTLDEAKYKIRSFRKTSVEYWLERGYSDTESLHKVKSFQKENSDRFVSKILENPENYTDRTSTQIGYWIRKGYTKTESELKLSERQDTVSLKSYITRYGEDVGLVKYNYNLKRKSYTSSRKYYTDKYGEDVGNLKYNSILKKRITPMTRASRESYIFLIGIYKYLRGAGIDKEDIYWGVGHSNEWFINSDKCLFFYDFTIKSLRVIIEYNGIGFHPNPNWSLDKKNSWRCVYLDLSYDDKSKIDSIKKDVAIKKGFTYIDVYSDEDLIKSKIRIIDILDKIISSK
jgi:hypothetical protein